MDYLKVKDRPDLVRDTNSKAILNKDLSALNKYKEERESKLKLVKVLQEHDEMKRELSDIKSLLNKILERIQ